MLLQLSILLCRSAALEGTCGSAPSFIGCFQDPYTLPDKTSRAVLGKQVAKADGNMTLSHCVSLCCAAGYGTGSIAGLEQGADCYCDHSFGPYTIPKESTHSCDAACTGDSKQKCGGTNRIQTFSITACPPKNQDHDQGWQAPFMMQHSGAVQTCGTQGCTKCPAEDTCCQGHSPDAYKVPGGYGCSPPTNITHGCASGGVFGPSKHRCCCGPGPSVVSATLPNVLVIGDSVSAGYTPYVRAALAAAANVQHGPDNTGGGNADGVEYGAPCTKYFVRTPQYELPPWDVITFNFGLHDGADSNATYSQGITSIADQLLAIAKEANPARPARLVYFQTTIPGGAGSVPGEPVSPNDKRVMELNEIAAAVMAARKIATVDLYATMTACGDDCKACKPHCGPAGYTYLTDHAIVPAIKKALAG